MKDKTKKLSVIAAPLATLVILLAVYAVKGVYPFGSGNIYGGDLYQLYIADYCHVIDAFKSGNLFYDFSTACGVDRSVLLKLFQPTTWFLLLFTKEKIVNAISLLAVIKLVFVSLGSAYAFSKLFSKLSPVWVTLLSLIYTFSGFDLQYFTNLNWLDVIALYPLLIYALLRMFNGKSKLMYVLILSYLLMIQTYMTFFIIVSFIIFGGLYFYIVDDPKKRKEHIFSLGIGTLISVVCSAYPIYSFMSGSLGSARYSEYSASGLSDGGLFASYGRIISTTGYKTFYFAVFMFIGAELAFACLAVMGMYSIKNKGFRRYTAFFGISMLLLGIQTVCIGCDYMWHGGSRVMFPFRNGFIVSFFACIIIGYYFTFARKRIDKNYIKGKYSAAVFFIFFICGTAAAIKYSGAFYTMVKEHFNVVSTYSRPKEFVIPFAVLFVIVTVTFISLLLIKYKSLRSLLTLAAVLTLIFTNTFAFVGNAEGSDRAEKYNSFYKDCFTAGSLLEKGDVFRRVSNPDISLITNYSYFAGTYSVSNWVNNLSDEQMDSFKNLGFTTIYTRTVDTGATAFSKALLRITDSVSKADLNDKLYEKTGESESGIKSYKNKYVLPFGLNTDSAVTSVKYEDYSNSFLYQNEIYTMLTGDKDLFTKAELTDLTCTQMNKADYVSLMNYVTSNPEGTVNLCKGRLKTAENCTLYAQLVNVDKEDFFYMLDVNGKSFISYRPAESVARDTNTIFPHDFDKNLIELGTFNGDEVEIAFDFVNANSSNIEFWLMDNSKLEALCNSAPETSYSVNGDSISITADCSGGMLFLPLTYTEKRSCTVNGKAVEAQKVLGSFTAIPVENGENKIEMTLSHKSAYFGFLTVFAGFAAAAAAVFLERRIKKYPDILKTAAYFAYIGISASSFILIYVIPVTSFIASRFK